jgi:hypothetical protein
MRLLFGIVLGAILTVGAAYYHDSTFAAPSATVPTRPIVNWDVAGGLANNATRAIRNRIGSLFSR